MLRTLPARASTSLVAASSLLLASLVAAGAAAPAVAASSEVYDSIPSTLDANYPSLGYQATSTSEFGDIVDLGAGDRALTGATVVMSSWACETGGGLSCVTEPGAGFEHDITLNIYAVDDSGALPAVGALLGSTTETQTIPYRPSASEECGDGRWTPDATLASCVNGYAFPISFDLTGLGIYAPDRIAVTVAYDTNTHGADPIGASGPYDSLNVAVIGTPPAIGAEEQDQVLLDSSWAGAYSDGGAGGTASLRVDEDWSGYGGLLLTLTADDSAVPTPTEHVTVRDIDVETSETAETYQSWHEGRNNATRQYRVGSDGLHLGISSASTIIKGTDVGTTATAAKVTQNELRELITGIASVTVESGNPTFQVPVHFGAGSPTGFTTLHVDLTPGVNTFATSQTWRTSRAFGGYSALQEDTLDAFLQAVFAQGGDVWLAGFGVQANTEAVVSSLTWDDTVYTFEQPVVGTCSAVASGPLATDDDANGWDFSETRTAGSNTFVDGGIRVTTVGATSQSKAAGYHAIDIALSEVGAPAMDLTQHSGGAPSI
ncbi:hypothetical protein FJ656_34975, partial [Schumannella luteola]